MDYSAYGAIFINESKYLLCCGFKFVILYDVVTGKEIKYI